MSEAIEQRGLQAESERKPFWEFWRKDPKYNRLRAALCGCRQQFHGMLGRSRSQSDAWWAECARRSLETAEAAMERRDYDGGWGAFHDAKRFLVFGMDGPELLLLASTLDAETKAKLKGWRLKAAKGLFRHIPLAGWAKDPSSLTQDRQSLLRHAVGESLSLLNEHSDNLYHRLGLVGLQLNYLVLWCAGLIAVALLGSYLFVPADSMFHWGRMAAVGLAGALGGVVSAMMQLSRVGEAKIPDALMQGLITSGRPLVGAASAIFIYAVMYSGVISFVEAPLTVTTGLVLGFVAGFSDRLVLGAIDRIAGEKASREGDSIDQFDNGPGRDGDKCPPAGPSASTSQDEKESQNSPAGNNAPDRVAAATTKKSGVSLKGKDPAND